MSAGWEIKKLADLCKTFADGDWVEKKDQSPSGIRLIQTGNVGNGVFRGKEDSRHYISQETFERLHCTEIFPGDILISRLPEPVGRGCLIPETGEKMITAVDCTIIRLNPGCLPQFLVYYSQSAEYQYSVREVSTGTTRQRISRKNLGEIGIPVPSLAEQLRIIDILDQEFAKIDALKVNAEKSLKAAKDLFQAILKKELEPKDGWKKKKLNEICEITTELIDPTLPEYINQIHIGGANIVAETGVLIDLKTSREENLISGKFPFDETMVLYSKIRPYLKKVCCPDFKGICSADIYPLKPFLGVDRTFLYYILLSQDFTDYAILGSARAGMPKVNRPYMFAYSCSIPEYEEQRRVANRLDAVREQTNALQDNYQKTLALCNDLKQSLLRKAFNGEL